MRRELEPDTTSSTDSEDELNILTPSSVSQLSWRSTEADWSLRGSLLPDPQDDQIVHSAAALATHHGRLYCVWSGQCEDRTSLFWATLGGDGAWGPACLILAGLSRGESRVDVVGDPAIADLNGHLHLVFRERLPRRAPLASTDGTASILMHLQFDDQSQTWGKRASLGVHARSKVALVGHLGQLICVFIDQEKSLRHLTWDKFAGWSGSRSIFSCTDHEQGFGMYASGGSLCLVHITGQAGSQRITPCCYDPTSRSWLQQPSLAVPEDVFGGDLNGTSILGEHFVAYRSIASRPAIFTPTSEGRWVVSEEIGSQTCLTAPAVAALDGVVTCVWVGEGRQNPELQWAQRRVLNTISMNQWMSGIDSDCYLSELSIPGSHESCATISVPWVQCQNITIQDQLRLGIRYFDFRCGVSFGRLWLYHGRSPLGLALSDVLAGMYAWLDQVPSEAIMLQIKMEGLGRGNESVFEALLRLEFSSHAEFWALGNAIPTLGDVRGKIQLIRRFHISSGTLGIDVRRWADNSPHFTIPLERHARLVVQDQYEYTNVVPTFSKLVQTKASAVNALIMTARHDPSPQVWYLNWCNAYASPLSLGVVATPMDIAIGRDDALAGGSRGFVSGINPSLSTTFFLRPVQGRFGTILLDFVETPAPELVSAIVMTNIFQ